MDATQSHTSFVGDGVHVVSLFPKLNETSMTASANRTNAAAPDAITERGLAIHRSIQADPCPASGPIACGALAPPAGASDRSMTSPRPRKGRRPRTLALSSPDLGGRALCRRR